MAVRLSPMTAPQIKSESVAISIGYLYRLEKNEGKLPTSDPVDEQTIPTTAAMINSKGHRLCELGSLAVSTATRARSAAGTAAPTTKITARRRVLPNDREASSSSATAN